ncbi:acid protease [Apiospora sp. TS-2023a]
MSVGDPPQHLAFMPTRCLVASLGNLSLVWPPRGYCGSNSEVPEAYFSQLACTTFRGGAYNSSASISRKDTDSKLFPNDKGKPEGPAADMYVLARLYLNNDTALEDYPVAIAMGPAQSSLGNLAMMQMGVGANSTLLHTLKDNGLIASRSWGLWWGRGLGMSPQIDGSLVLGGYDKARVVGDPLVADISPSPGCISGLSLPVADIVASYAGNTSSLLGSEANRPPSRFCLEPYRPTIIRLAVDANLLALGRLLDNAGFNFTLTITFGPGLSVDFTADELVVPNVRLDRDNREMITNSDEPVLLLVDALAQDSSMRLGAQFLTAAYLLVNHDANKFYLWRVRSGAEELEAQATAVDASNNELPDVCGSELGARRPPLPDRSVMVGCHVILAAATTQTREIAYRSRL